MRVINISAYRWNNVVFGSYRPKPQRGQRPAAGRLTSWIAVLLLGILQVGTARAQATQQFTGHVLDSTGALVPYADVVVHNQGTGVDVRTATTSSGVYTVTYLDPGSYTVTVSKKGFKIEQKTDVVLNVDQTSTLDFALSPGSETETITVRADEAAQVELSKSDRGEIIDGKRIEELPLDGRNPLDLFSLSPGTHDFSNSQYPRPFDAVTDNQYANGSPQQGAINLDGITNDTGGGNTGFVPSVDVVQQFKVVLNAYDASYGHAGGSAIDLALKSGGNKFHGTVYEFARRSWLDDTPWQTKYNGSTAKPQHKRDQYGFEAEGPVIIPRLYNGKDKLFYVLSYEQMNEILPNPSGNTFSLPNPAWLTGDFSTATYYNAGTNSLQPLIIYDPLSPLQTIVDPLDGKTKQAHSPFPGNIIPPNRIDPVGAKLLSYYNLVTPNVNPGLGFAPWTNNYYNLEVEHDTWRNALVKVDYHLSDRDTLSFHWGGQGRWSVTNSITGYPDSDPANMNGHQAQPKSETGTAQWTHTFSPTLLLDFISTLMTQGNYSHQGPTFASNFMASSGFASSFYNQLSNNNHFPYLTASGVTNGQQYGYMDYVNQGSSYFYHELGFLPTVTWIKGAHTIRAGIDLRFEQFDNPIAGNNDTFAFTSNFTNEFYNSPDAPNYTSGLSIASWLLGYPNSGAVYNNLHSFTSQHYFAPWAQDDWKITQRLTLNLGVRWDFLTPLVERHNKLEGAFNATVVNPVSSQIAANTLLGSNPVLQGGMEFAGVNGQPRAAYAVNMLDVQPRLGFAYAITQKMSIRGGIGQNLLNDESTDSNSGFSSSTAYTNSLDNGITPFTATTGQGLSNPIPNVIQPTGSSLGYLQSLGSALSFINPHFHIPSLWSYSVTYEVGLGKHDNVNVSYVGNREPNGPVTDDLNHISPAFNAQCDIERGGNRQNCDSTALGQITNPFLNDPGFAGTSYYNSSTLSKSILTRPYPEFQGISESGASNNSRNWYNALQVVASHQMKSASVHFAYTHARSESAGTWLDTVNRIVARQVSTTNDVKHAITASGVLYLPFGRNREFLSGVNRWVDAIVNDWEISPLYTYYSGFPWRPSGNWEMASSGSAVDTSMGVAHTLLPADGAHSFKRLRGATPCVGYKDTDTGLVIPSPSATAAGCTSIPFVTAPNGYALPRVNIDFGIRQPGAYRFDVAIAKSFSIPWATKVFLSDVAKLQVRVDMLNALNHPDFDTGYNGSSSSLDFGTISKGPTGPTNTPRYLQLAAKLNW